MIFRRIAQIFENWIDPLAGDAPARPPEKLWAFLWYFLKQARWPFFAMLIVGGGVAVMETASFWFMGVLVDFLDDTPRAEGWQGLIAVHGGALLAMAVAMIVVRVGLTTLQMLIEEQTIVPGFNNLVRWQSYRYVARQSLDFFQNDFAGRIVTKVTAAGQAIGDLMSSLLQVVWFMAIYAISTMALVGRLDWRLAALIAAWIVIFAALARYFVPRIRENARELAEANSVMSGRMVDSFSNISTLKLFGSDEGNDRYMRGGFERLIATVQRFTRFITGVRASLSLLSGVMITLIAALSVHLWFSSDISSGDVAFTLGLALRLSMLLGRLMMQLNGIMRAIGTIQNSAELISKPITLIDKPDAARLVVEEPSIRFENVGFSYGGEKGVIDDLTLEVAAGEKVGIIGRSGAGKSTLVNLLLRFYDVEAGRILIDGKNVANVTQESLRAHIGMVTQDTGLLHRPIRDNIRFGSEDADDDALWEAVERAEADGFIADLADMKGRRGFDAFVGERGVKLSGGQRQRIAISRVMLKNAPILVLDEATSALDSEVEAAIQTNLMKLMEGKTVLAIAHRLSTIAALDRLVVMDNGKIVEQGTHQQLLDRSGLYATFWARQSGGFLPELDV
ncbi:ABC transporter ATP-binding protein [Martelella mediterranea]|uniref:ATP-binding cassette subfamily B multidrug efflux pump n=1 Tax=Martelella mediterranea TaxID=293089 RepID=A0A4R3NT43_9HYPH|nr:ABC transporter ATP-binding protein [Martelella mediterranea]TCT40183.1 ATP-binding cassette subfamily B multidrug efflux pump [Martelella mediterranea]